jgi:hypothetical protein
MNFIHICVLIYIVSLYYFTPPRNFVKFFELFLYIFFVIYLSLGFGNGCNCGYVWVVIINYYSRGDIAVTCVWFFCLPLEGVPVGGGWIPVKLYFKMKHNYHMLKIILKFYPPPPFRHLPTCLPQAGEGGQKQIYKNTPPRPA